MSIPDFSNTAIAFRMHSNGSLLRARWLFRSIGHPWLVKTGNAFVNFALKAGLPVGWIIRPTIYKQFVGGETLGKCEPAVKSLARYGVKSVLDYSVEGKESDADMEAALAETLLSVKNAAGNPDIPFAVFKPTAFIPHSVLDKVAQPWTLTGADHEHIARFRARVDTLCAGAARAGKPILIDAEDSWYQNFVDEVVEQMMQRYNRERAIVFNTLQMYRHDRLSFLKSQHRKALDGGYFLGVKFVRGAYMEKERDRAARLGYPSPIQPDKQSTDRDFDAALSYSIENIGQISVFCGTHNENSCLHLAGLMEQHHLAFDDQRIWFSQLYGMSDHISFNLAASGYNVAKYVPYGPVKHVIPYLARRAEENTSVKGQTGRELSLIIKEMKRRKNE